MKQSRILRRCYDFVEAEAIRTRLDAASILAVINGADGHVMLSYIGTALGGVTVEVAPEDYDRAVKLLEQDELNAKIAGPWICRQCSEQNEATFELCWNCQKPRNEGDERLLADQAIESLPEPTVDLCTAISGADDNNPYRPVLLDDARDEVSAGGVKRGQRNPVIAAILIVLLFYFLAYSAGVWFNW